jgi:hypothetical protein
MIKVLQVMPEAVNDAAATLQDIPLQLDVAANDISGPDSTLALGSLDLNPAVNGQQDSFSIVGEGLFTATPAAKDGLVTFTPAPGFVGTAIQPYTISDSFTHKSNVATISITVNSSGSANLIANDDHAVTSINSTVTVAVLDNDVTTNGYSLLPETLALTPPLTKAYGDWSVDASTGEVVFTPGSMTGVFNIPYTVQDNHGDTSRVATITVEVTGGGATPIAVNDAAATKLNTAVVVPILDNDIASSGNTLTPESIKLLAAGQNGSTRVVTNEGVWEIDFSGLLTFTPSRHQTGSGKPFTGTAIVNYTVNDTGGGTPSNQATISIQVEQVTLVTNSK